MPVDFPLKAELFAEIKKAAEKVHKVKDIPCLTEYLSKLDNVTKVCIDKISLGTGKCTVNIDMPNELFYKTLSESTELEISNDRQLIGVLTELARIKRSYERIYPAVQDVYSKGYGIILPSNEDMTLEEPEIVRRNGRYGVKLKASAPSIHLIRADIETEVSPAVGGAGTSEEIIGLLLQDFEGDKDKIWESNLFGKSLYDIAGEDLINKVQKMPADTQSKMRSTLQRIVNEGSGGVICIIL